MTDDRTPNLYSRDVAARAMRRAARLQVEAAELAERHSAPAHAEPADGYARDELVAAAREAGIDEEFVSIALAELEGAAQTNALALADEAQENAATRWLGTTQRNVLVTPCAGWRASWRRCSSISRASARA